MIRVTLRNVRRVSDGLRCEDSIILIRDSDGEGRAVGPPHFDDLEAQYNVLVN